MIKIRHAYKIMSLILILFLLTSCSIDTETIEYSKLEEEYNKLHNDYQNSLKEMQELENKYNEKIADYNNLKEDYDKLIIGKDESQSDSNQVNSYYDVIKSYKIEGLLSEISYLYEKVKYPEKNKDLTLLNMYNEELINEGDSLGDMQVASLTKQNLYEGVNAYSIAFEGEFVVEGRIFFDAHDVAVGIQLSKDEVKKIPHTYYQRDNGICFNFDENSDEFISAINKKYPDIKTIDDLYGHLQKNDQEIYMKAKFDNLSVNYLVGKHVSNYADLIEILEIK